MKLVLPLLLLISCCAISQEVPRYELSTGYSYGNVTNASAGYGLSPRGWLGSFAANVKRWAALEAEAGGQYNNQLVTLQGAPYTVNAGFYSFLAGPRINYRRGRATPFAHGLFGVVRTVAYDKATINTASGTAFLPYENGLGTAVGGGIDYGMNRHVTLRTQADYFLTQPGGNFGVGNQNNFRVAAAVVFTFGGMPGFGADSAAPQPAVPASASSEPEESPYELHPRPRSVSESLAEESQSAAPAPVASAPAAVAVVGPAAQETAAPATSPSPAPIPAADAALQPAGAMSTATAQPVVATAAASEPASAPAPEKSAVPVQASAMAAPAAQTAAVATAAPAAPATSLVSAHPAAETAPPAQAVPSGANAGAQPGAVAIAPPQQDSVIAGFDPSAQANQQKEEPLGDVARRFRNDKKHRPAQQPLQ